MTKIAVSGVAGRMGGNIARLVYESSDLELVGAVEAPGNPAVGKTVGEVLGLKGADVKIESEAQAAVKDKARVFIDFTAPEATVNAVKQCADCGVKAVVGTTGLSKAQVASLAQAAQKVAVVFAPNMSLGMNLLRKLVHMASGALGEDYDIELVEAHHRMKADAPSGSALMLGRAAAEGRGWDLDSVAVYGREGRTGPRPTDQIGIMTIRGGDIVGDHTVIFAGSGERIELRHQAHTRDTFANGALRAARWVADKEPNLYSMSDVLGIS